MTLDYMALLLNSLSLSDRLDMRRFRCLWRRCYKSHVLSRCLGKVEIRWLLDLQSGIHMM